MPILVVALIALLSVGLPASEVQARPSTERVVMSYASTLGTCCSWFWVAEAAGLFQKYGLETDQVLIRGGPTSVQALLAGDIQVMTGDAVATYAANLRGADLVIFASGHNRLTYGLVGGRGIKGPQDLRGKKVGARLGGRSEAITRMLLAGFGLQAGRDVELFQVAGSEARTAALISGQIQGGALSFPELYRARAMGMTVLGVPDLPDLNGPATTTRRYLQAHRPLLKNLVKGLADGVHFYRTNRVATLKILARYMRESDPKVVEYTYDLVVKGLAASPAVPREAVEKTIEVIAAQEPQIRTIDPFRFVDNSLAEELDAEGFLRGLESSSSRGPL